MIINIIYKSDHYIADILYLSDHLLIFSEVNRYSLDDQLHVYYFCGLYPYTICQIREFYVRHHSKALISIIILLLFFSCISILIEVSGIIIRIISFYYGYYMPSQNFFSNDFDPSTKSYSQRIVNFDLSYWNFLFSLQWNFTLLYGVIFLQFGDDEWVANKFY